MSDIVAELRERALRAEQEGDPIALLDDAADEIERLRLTDAERCAISAGLRSLERDLYAHRENCGGKYRDMDEDAAMLRGLLERTK